MKINTNYRVRNIAGEGVIIPIMGEESEKPDIYAMNEMAVQILNYISDGKSIDEIVTLINTEYDADVNTIERDVHEYISYLKAHGIVEE